MATSSPTNPYESPREATPKRLDFSDDRAAELADLQRRLSEMERRLQHSWVTHPNVFVRTCGVWGYFLLGYGIMIAIALGVGALVWLVTGHWIF
jgi:hypothetical protein